MPLARDPLPFPHLPMLGNINFLEFSPTPHQGCREGSFIMGLRAGGGTWEAVKKTSGQDVVEMITQN